MQTIFIQNKYENVFFDTKSPLFITSLSFLAK